MGMDTKIVSSSKGDKGGTLGTADAWIEVQVTLY